MNFVHGLVFTPLGDMKPGSLALFQFDGRFMHGFLFVDDRDYVSVLILEGPRAGQMAYPESEIVYVYEQEVSVRASVAPQNLSITCPQSTLPLCVLKGGSAFFMVDCNGMPFGINVESGLLTRPNTNRALYVSNWWVEVEGEDTPRLVNPTP